VEEKMTHKVGADPEDGHHYYYKYDKMNQTHSLKLEKNNDV
jgi:hypothetical protein